MNYKIFWFFRAVVYKLFFGSFLMPSYIGKPIFINRPRKIFIGKRVRILPSSRIEVIDDSSSIIIGDNTSIGQNFHIISGGSQILKIGQNTTISANVFISNVNHDYREINQHILEQKLLFKKTLVGDNCFLGYGSIIQPGTVLGEQCIVGANSVVKGTYPAYCVIAGIPAIVIKRYNEKNNVWQITDSKGNFINE